MKFTSSDLIQKLAEIARCEQIELQKAFDEARRQREPYINQLRAKTAAKATLESIEREHRQAVARLESLTNADSVAPDDLENARRLVEASEHSVRAAQEAYDALPEPDIDPNTIHPTSVEPTSDEPSFSELVRRMKLAHSLYLRIRKHEALTEVEKQQMDFVPIQNALKKKLGLGRRQKVTIKNVGTNNPVFIITVDGNASAVFRTTQLTGLNMTSYIPCYDYEEQTVTFEPDKNSSKRSEAVKVKLPEFVTETKFVILADPERTEVQQKKLSLHEVVEVYTFSEFIAGCNLATYFTSNDHYVSDADLIPEALDIASQIAVLFYYMWEELTVSGSANGSEERITRTARALFEDGKGTNILLPLDPKSKKPLGIKLSDLKSLKVCGLLPDNILSQAPDGTWFINTSSPAYGGAVTTTAYNLIGRIDGKEIDGDNLELNSKNPHWLPEAFLCHVIACNLYEMLTRNFLCDEEPEQNADEASSAAQAQQQPMARDANARVSFDFNHPIFESSNSGALLKSLILRLSARARNADAAHRNATGEDVNDIHDDAITSLREAALVIKGLQTKLEKVRKFEVEAARARAKEEKKKKKDKKSSDKGPADPAPSSPSTPVLGRLRRNTGSSGSVQRRGPGSPVPKLVSVQRSESEEVLQMRALAEEMRLNIAHPTHSTIPLTPDMTLEQRKRAAELARSSTDTTTSDPETLGTPSLPGRSTTTSVSFSHSSPSGSRHSSATQSQPTTTTPSNDSSGSSDSSGSEEATTAESEVEPPALTKSAKSPNSSPDRVLEALGGKGNLIKPNGVQLGGRTRVGTGPFHDPTSDSSSNNTSVTPRSFFQQLERGGTPAPGDIIHRPENSGTVSPRPIPSPGDSDDGQ